VTSVLVVLDSNVLFDDPVMVRETASEVLKLLSPAGAILVFSPVVVAELKRHRLDAIRDLGAEADSRVKRLSRLAGVSAAEALHDTNTMRSAAAARLDARWNEILNQDCVDLASWPAIDVREMVQRELERRRPFMDKEPGTIGHRDTVIWLGVLELAEHEPADDVVFVTADKGFLASSTLHPHLVEDLCERGLERQVEHLPSLQALVVKLREAMESTGWESWRKPKVVDAIAEELSRLDASEFTPHWDAREGDVASPRFDLGLPVGTGDWTLTHIDGPTELTIHDAPYEATEVACTFVAEVGLSGFMEKYEWYSDDHPEVELWDADWSDHVVSIETFQRVRFRAEVAIDDVEEVVREVNLLAVATEGPDGGITLG
jgi:hypothetical protein